MASNPGYVSPYAARIAEIERQTREAEDRPFGPMFTPEEQERRTTENARNYQLGVLAQLSGDKVMGNVGEPVLKQAMEERKRKITEHGEYDPLTGQLNMFPEYKRQKTIDRLTREQGRLTEQEARSYAQWNADRQRAQDKEDLARVIAANRPVQENWKFVGFDEGKPLLMDKHGRFATPGPTPGTLTPHVPKSPEQRATHEKNVKELETLEDTNTQLKGMLTRVQTPQGREAYGTGTAAEIVKALPIFRGLASENLYTPEETQLRAAIQSDSYNQAVKIAGVAQTLGEQWRFEPFLVQPTDTDEQVIAKLTELHRKSNEVMARKRARMGGGPPATPKPPGATPTINYDASGKRM